MSSINFRYLHDPYFHKGIGGETKMFTYVIVVPAVRITDFTFV